uniref:Uncharacterized protein n=1 Tax=Anguilla anguilla TaxID=7936 RepID=A0A0E9U2G0_ANGAN
MQNISSCLPSSVEKLPWLFQS